MAEILRKHSGMTRDIIKQVPEILEHPVIVLKSQNSDSRIAIFGEVKDANGVPVTAILELQPTNKGGQVLDMNVVASVYGKTNNIANFIKNSDLLYLDRNKNRTNNWLSAVGLQLPSVTPAHYGSIGSITYQDGKVKIVGVPYEQYMQATRENVNGKFAQQYWEEMGTKSPFFRYSGRMTKSCSCAVCLAVASGYWSKGKESPNRSYFSWQSFRKGSNSTFLTQVYPAIS